MKISATQWEGFRNLKPRRLQWVEGLHLLLGPNGSGKTNVLEALHILTGWGSLRGGRTSDLRSWSDPGRGTFLSADFDGEETLEVRVGIGARIVARKGGSPLRSSQLRPLVPSLIFLPNDLSLVEGSPATRRRLVDRLCALLFPLYALRLHEYGRALRQRNAALRQGRNLAATARVMAPLATWIWACRLTATDLIRNGLEKGEGLLPRGVTVELKRGGKGLEDLHLDFWESLEACQKQEKTTGACPIGPQRDDLLIRFGEKDVARCFSRGYRRRVAIALLLSSGWAVERKMRRKPILLLDEVMAELDLPGRERLIEVLLGTGWQVFAATAEACTPEWPGSIWSVEGGRVDGG